MTWLEWIKARIRRVGHYWTVPAMIERARVRQMRYW